MKQQKEGYGDRVAAFLREYQRCQFTGCRYKSRDVHHKAGRIGKWLTYEPYWMAVCRRHHDWIHANATEAESLGWILRIRETFDHHINRQWPSFPDPTK